MSRTLAERIVDTLKARDTGLLPHDYDEELAHAVDHITERYMELRNSGGFGTAARQAKVEYIEHVLTEHFGAAKQLPDSNTWQALRALHAQLTAGEAPTAEQLAALGTLVGCGPAPATLEAEWRAIADSLPDPMVIVEVLYNSGDVQQDWLECLGEVCGFSDDIEDPIVAWRPLTGLPRPEISARLEKTLRRRAEAAECHAKGEATYVRPT